MAARRNSCPDVMVRSQANQIYLRFPTCVIRVCETKDHHLKRLCERSSGYASQSDEAHYQPQSFILVSTTLSRAIRRVTRPKEIEGARNREWRFSSQSSPSHSS